jgi:hypothetical protein
MPWCVAGAGGGFSVGRAWGGLVRACALVSMGMSGVGVAAVGGRGHCLWIVSLGLGRAGAGFSLGSIDSLYLRVPGSRDVAVLCPQAADDRYSDCITPAAHARTRDN